VSVLGTVDDGPRMVDGNKQLQCCGQYALTNASVMLILYSGGFLLLIQENLKLQPFSSHALVQGESSEKVLFWSCCFIMYLIHVQG